MWSKYCRNWGHLFWQHPLTRSVHCTVKQPPDACCMHLVGSRRALYHLALGNGLMNDKLVKHRYFMGNECDGSARVWKGICVGLVYSLLAETMACLI